MSTRVRLIATLLFVLASLALSSVALGDVASLAEDCDDCHGQDGVSEWSDVPTIAGISAYAHSDALFIFLDRARPCVSSEYRRGDTSREETDMCETVDDLTEDEIEEIGEYYAAKPFVPAKQEFDAAKAAAGQKIHDKECEKCHIDGGTNPEEDASILAGQWTEYLQQSFDAYMSGDRDQPKKMKEKMEPLSEQDIDALLHYYASQQ
jgi:sulfide dehydrogenase cytochrome subunit